MSKIIDAFQKDTGLVCTPVKGKKYDIELVKHFGKMKIYRSVSRESLTDKELEELIACINKGDEKAFATCTGKIRKVGLLYRLCANNNKSKKDPISDNAGRSGTAAAPAEKKPKSNDNKGNEPEAKTEPKKEEKKEEGKKEEKQPDNNKSNNQLTAEEQAILDSEND